MTTDVFTRPCKQAPGYRTREGYARIWDRDQNREDYAHRKAYREFYGPIPDGHDVDHRCHNLDLSCPGGPTCIHRGCIEPTHLEAVPHQVNVLRGRGPCADHARQTHCKRGHEFTEANTYRRHDAPHHRNCRECIRIRGRHLDARSKAARAGEEA